jgi:hypothetical protein
MRLMRLAVTLAFGVGIMAGAVSAQAQHRELGAHEHGRGTLNLAVEGKRLSMELEVPGADIVGFEHAAKTRQQKAAVEKAKKQLLAPQSLFKFSGSAGCTVSSATVELEGGGHEGTKSAGEKHGHSEFHAQYSFDCQTPADLTAIEFDYFRVFAGAQRLDVTVITPKGQTKFEVSRRKPRIDLAGMM